MSPAGALPYLGTAVSTLYSAQVAGSLAAGHAARVDFDTAMNVLEAATQVQVTYGAVLLSFLGALHWGMEFTGYGGYKGVSWCIGLVSPETNYTVSGYRRLALGAAPVAFAWSTLALDPTLALVAQWVGFSAMVRSLYAYNLGDVLIMVNFQCRSGTLTCASPSLVGVSIDLVCFSTRDVLLIVTHHLSFKAPIWYSQYRFYLSILIGSCILTTLWAQPYLNPVIEDIRFLSDTTLPASSNTPEHLNAAGKFSGSSENLGELETVEGDTYYVMVKHNKAEEAAEASDDGEESAKEHVESASKDQMVKHEEIKADTASEKV